MAAVNTDGTHGPWSAELKVRLPAKPLNPPTVMSVGEAQAVVRLPTPPWVFTSTTAAPVPPPAAAPAPTPKPTPKPLALLPCCARRPDDQCWYPHYDPAEDARYYFQPASRRSSWDPIAEAVARGLQYVVLVPEHRSWLEVWDHKQRWCVATTCAGCLQAPYGVVCDA